MYINFQKYKGRKGSTLVKWPINHNLNWKGLKKNNQIFTSEFVTVSTEIMQNVLKSCVMDSNSRFLMIHSSRYIQLNTFHEIIISLLFFHKNRTPALTLCPVSLVSLFLSPIIYKNWLIKPHIVPVCIYIYEFESKQGN